MEGPGLDNRAMDKIIEEANEATTLRVQLDLLKTRLREWSRASDAHAQFVLDEIREMADQGRF